MNSKTVLRNKSDAIEELKNIQLRRRSALAMLEKFEDISCKPSIILDEIKALIEDIDNYNKDTQFLVRFVQSIGKN